MRHGIPDKREFGLGVINHLNSRPGRIGQFSARFLMPRGDDIHLLGEHKPVVIDDITFRFAKKCLHFRDHTIDATIQPARSGKPNIAEDGKAATTSKESPFKLSHVARSSSAELIEDDEYFLRERELGFWAKESRDAQSVRRLSTQTPNSHELYRAFVETRPPDGIASIAPGLPHQAVNLLNRQLVRLEEDSIAQRRLPERMPHLRRNHRRRPQSP